MKKQEGKDEFEYVPATRAQLNAYAKKLQQSRNLSWTSAVKMAAEHERMRAQAYLKNVYVPQDAKDLDNLTKEK